MRKNLGLIFIILSTLGSVSCAQIIKQKSARAMLIGSIDSLLQSQVDLDKIPGAVIEIKRSGQVIWRQAYGFAAKYDFDHKLLNPPEKMTVNHLFDLASLTKVIGTTTSVMILYDRGLLNIEDPVCKYIRAFDTPEKRTITIRNLLTHTAGLCEWYPLYYRVSGKQESYRLIAELPLMFPVGKQRRYSDLGFMLLGEIVEIVSGMALDEFEETNIFKPLAMKNTTYNPLKNGRFNMIASTSHGNPYEKRMVYDSTLGFRFKEINPDQWNGWRKYTLRGEVNDGNTWYAFGGISGAAGLFSDADDLQKLVDLMMNKGTIGSVRLISEKTINTFLTKDAFNNGLGWMMDPENSFMKNGPDGTFGHTGFTGPSIAVIPKFNASVILLINRQNTGLLQTGVYYNVNSLSRQVFNAVLTFCK